MTSPAFMHDVGAFLTVSNVFNPRIVTAGTTVENEQTGDVIDRGLGAGSNLALSAKIAVPYNYTLAAAKTATLSFKLQDSATTASTDFSDYADKDGTTSNSVATAATTASQTPSGILSGDFDLSSAKRYLRVKVTPTLSATVTDTADIAAVMVFGGSGALPGS